MRIQPIAGFTLVLVGCSSGSSTQETWAGSTRDSAGAIIVENPQSGLWTPETQWRLQEDLRIGVRDGDPEQQFNSIDDIGVDGSGHIYILDGSEIRVFSRDGEFVRTIGREGSGPGELARPFAVLIGPADTIFLPDTRNQRVQRFLSDGSDAGSFSISLNEGISLGWEILPDGMLLQEVRTLPSDVADERILLLLRDDDGEVIDTLMEMPIGEAMAIRDGQPQMTLFGPEPLWTVLTDGRIVSGRTSEYRLELRNADGRLERVVSKPFERRSFSEADQREFRARLAASMEGVPPSPARDRLVRSMSYADHYPTFASLFGGPDGTIWVQRAKDVSSITASDLEAYDVRAIGAATYDVFDADGRHLGQVAPPRGFEPLHSAGSYVYGIGRDDLGVQYVVRLQVVD